MMGIKGTPEPTDRDRWAALLRHSNTKPDLARIGIETPEELAAMFVMDGDEIDRIAADAKPLTDIYPKRLGESTEVDPAIHEFSSIYMRSAAATERFRSSRLLQQVCPDAATIQIEPFFVIREIRYRSRLDNRNWLADLDIHLRGSNLREPVLETLGTNSFRVELVHRERAIAASDQPAPIELYPDMIADQLAARKYDTAIILLEEKRSKGSANRNDLLLLTYLYCLNQDVGKAEAVAPTIPNGNEGLSKWLFGKLQGEYGFKPPQ